MKPFKLQLAFATLFMLAGYKSGKAHPFHVSICQIDVTAHALQITHKVFRDDLELEIQRLYKRQLIAEDDQFVAADSLFEVYLKAHFQVATDGEVQDFIYIGHELDFDVVWIYVEIPLDADFKAIAVENEILLFTYDDQTNIVHVEKNGSTKSMLLNSKNSNALVEFK